MVLSTTRAQSKPSIGPRWAPHTADCMHVRSRSPSFFLLPLFGPGLHRLTAYRIVQARSTKRRYLPCMRLPLLSRPGGRWGWGFDIMRQLPISIKESHSLSSSHPSASPLAHLFQNWNPYSVLTLPSCSLRNHLARLAPQRTPRQSPANRTWLPGESAEGSPKTS